MKIRWVAIATLGFWLLISAHATIELQSEIGFAGLTPQVDVVRKENTRSKRNNRTNPDRRWITLDSPFNVATYAALEPGERDDITDKRSRHRRRLTWRYVNALRKKIHYLRKKIKYLKTHGCHEKAGKVLCENRRRRLNCRRGTVIHITKAFYGRQAHKKVCGIRRRRNCSARWALRKLRRHCHHRRTCVIRASNRIFGDPCRGTPKYLKFQYRCVRSGGRPWRPGKVLCENHRRRLKCRRGTVIHITRAFYGRKAHKKVCGIRRRRNCSARWALRKLRRHCHHRRTCVIRASNHIFGDPCRGTPKYLKFSYRCVRARKARPGKVLCENRRKKLKCKGGTVIYITKAFYGRQAHKKVCGIRRRRNCSARWALRKLRRYCNHRRACVIKASNRIFGDPCRGTPKYLKFQYRCIRSGGRPWRPKKVLCENHRRKLKCKGGTVIQITRAFYGREANKRICGRRSRHRCKARAAKINLMKRCNGKKICLVYASNRWFGDPCKGTRKYLKFKYRCVRPGLKRPGKVLCENRKRRLQCRGGTVIRITKAFYGREAHVKVCGIKRRRNCSARWVLRKLRRYCNHRRACVIKASNRIFGDPCRGTPKYLKFQYRCVRSGVLPWRPKKVLCENHRRKLRCKGGTVIKITRAFYGREANKRVCGIRSHRRCTARAATMKLMKRCNGKKICLVYASNRWFGDPCKGTRKYLKFKYRCVRPGLPRPGKVLCENRRRRLKCRGGTVIDITMAFYGREAHHKVCGIRRHKNCSARWALRKLRRHCNYRRACVIRASNRVFGDPCRGTPKYLKFRYRCVRSGRLPWRPKKVLCENHRRKLRCKGGTVIRITRAFYGREANKRICGIRSRHRCTARAATMKLMKRCNGKKICLVYASNRWFGDPCKGTRKYLKFKYRCVRPGLQRPGKVLCENRRRRLKCRGGTVIDITMAFYGREAHKKVCGIRRRKNCSARWALRKLRRHCNHRSACVIKASNRVFGDPCRGTPKYLKFQYHCIRSGGQPWRPGNVVCENRRRRLKCGGGTVIDITMAFYGRKAHKKVCGIRRHRNCSARWALRKLRRHCNHRRSCVIRASNRIFGDPCRGTPKYLKFRYRCVRARLPRPGKVLCENRRRRLKCRRGRVIDITMAFYGREAHKKVCGTKRRRYCSARWALRKLRRHCNHRRACVIRASNRIFGDPCRGTPKYLKFRYRCVKSRKAGKVLCENRSRRLNCRRGTVIHITMAFYGRQAHRKVCGVSRRRNCSARWALRKLRRHCNHRRSCVIRASNRIFGDPCRGTPKYLKFRYRCVRARKAGKVLCENRSRRLNCRRGTVIHITKAFYGRQAHRKVCGIRRRRNCSARWALRKLRRHCNHRRSCVIRASNRIFGDPCRGTPKYLKFRYRCVRSRWQRPGTVLCENHRKRLKCRGGTAIDITMAFYGRKAHRKVCGIRRRRNCSAKLALRKLRRHCNHRRACVIRASNHIFGDPCRGTPKYLEFRYRCVRSGGLPWRPKKVVCENHRRKLRCGDGTVIRITRAFYGREANKKVCGIKSSHRCTARAATMKLMKRCNGRKICLVYASNRWFGDPCKGTRKYLKFKYRCVKPGVPRPGKVVCENRKRRLKCRGGTSIDITMAFYGREAHHKVCGIKRRRNCSARWALRKLRRHCNHRRACVIKASNRIFGDPCRGTPKYLKFQYRCVRTGGLPWRPKKVLCENHRRKLRCKGGTVIRITKAFYGREANKRVCGIRSRHRCTARAATMKLMKRCNGKKICLVYASNKWFGDPCKGTRKYLKFKYRCIRPRLRRPGKVLCENRRRRLKCRGGTVIDITMAFYGREAHIKECGTKRRRNCSARWTLRKLRRHCNHRRACVIQASNRIFGDPCRGTPKYLKFQYRCIRSGGLPWRPGKVLCENRRRRLRCRGGTVIQITKAFYGREGHRKVCGIRRRRNCSARWALRKLRRHCNHKRVCWIRASNRIFGDPCRGTPKYLKFHYRCIRAKLPKPGKVLCENRRRRLKCRGGTVIDITMAFYGREAHKKVCGIRRRRNCSARWALRKLRRHCNHRRACVIKASNRIFGDPCHGTPKYLKFLYRCVRSGRRPWRPKTVVCENRRRKLRCKVGTVIRITRAFYGREANKRVCGKRSPRRCSARAATMKLIKHCNGRKICLVYASNSWFGDPCKGTRKYLKFKYRCVRPGLPRPGKVLCENRRRRLKCRGGTVIDITMAFYGREAHRKVCGIKRHRNCSARWVLRKLRRHCNRRRACVIKASNRNFGDPCRGTPKYLKFQYRCIRSGGLPWRPKKVLCENHRRKLRCKGGTVIRITRAFYGREANKRVCGIRSRHRCTARAATMKLMKRCNGKKICLVYASNKWFGDPCKGTRKYLKFKYRCVRPGLPRPGKVLCENHKRRLKCRGGTVIDITMAFYGREAHHKVCGIRRPRNCSARWTLRKLRRYCNHRRACVIKASNRIFGDPCRGVPKYLKFRYRCVRSGVLPWRPKKVVCENHRRKLRCKGGTVIKITRAFYGREANKRVCGIRSRRRCTARAATMKLSKRCNGKKICLVYASNSWFGDPCKGTRKYLKFKYRCLRPVLGRPGKVLCENRRRRLKCRGGTVIHITKAFYGREAHHKVCGIRRRRNCSARWALRKLRRHCNYRRACVIRASNRIFGDPCRGTPKYLKFQYRCIRSGGIPWRPGKVLCENRRRRLKCRGGTVIHITKAFYGREAHHKVCGIRRRRNCSARWALRKLRRHCSHRRSCVIRASNHIFGDPCRGTPKYLKFRYRCVRAKLPKPGKALCENRRRRLNCRGGTVIDITMAFYGREAHMKVCGIRRRRNCSARWALRKLRRHCNHRRACVIRASNHIFGDPCRGTPKYLKLQYRCIKAGGRPWRPGKILCENRKRRLKCKGGTVIDITMAFYGRKAHKKVCGIRRRRNCSARWALRKLRRHCNHRRACVIWASNRIFGDPCRGTPKYLQFRYRCVRARLPKQGNVLCENHKRRLKCRRGTVIYITKAFYGREAHRKVCGIKRRRNCSARWALRKLRRHCHHRRRCVIRASNRLFGDPCRGTPKYLKFQYRCVRARLPRPGKVLCENRRRRLNCRRGTVIHITRAFYGREAHKKVCGIRRRRNCSARWALRKLRRHCNHRRSCVIRASNRIFGDPCRGTPKYLKFQYRCVRARLPRPGKVLCENHGKRLNCRRGTVIHITRAFYGREAHKKVCGIRRRRNCSARWALRKLRRHCNHRRSCVIRASNRIFGDPCRGTPKYLKFQYRCVRGRLPRPGKVLCENHGKRLNCRRGTVIHITRAFYGREAHKKVCGIRRRRNCSARWALRKLRRHCNHRRSCVIRASNRIFGDPCRGTPKYLKFQYRCVRGRLPRPGKVLCENHGKRLNCRRGTVIHITRAFYGREAHKKVCGIRRRRNCSARWALRKLRRHCNHRRSCVIRASNRIFGDPCRGTPKYLKFQYRCVRGRLPRPGKVLCENHGKRLNCRRGTVIHITRAFYGREAHKKVCGIRRRRNCSARWALRKLRRHCNHRRSCVIRASNRIFGDPCRGTPKYLKFQYRCVKGRLPRPQISWRRPYIPVYTKKQRGKRYYYTKLSKKGFHLKKNQKCFEFKVKTCTYAFVALFEATGLKYEIIIGGSRRGTSFIRNWKGQILARRRGAYLNCNAYRSFKVCWHKQLRVWRWYRNRYVKILQANVHRRIKVWDIGITSARYGKAWWRIHGKKTKGRSQNRHKAKEKKKPMLPEILQPQAPSAAWTPGRGQGWFTQGSWNINPYGYWTYGEDGGKTWEATVCEHRKRRISCRQGEVLAITAASYGRKSRHTCNKSRKQYKTINCHAQSSLPNVRERCNGRQTCLLHASNSVFHDPCRGVYKYLEVEYLCMRIVSGPFTKFITTKQRHKDYTYNMLTDYGYYLGKMSTSYIFRVKACKNVYVSLMRDSSDNKHMYEIILGARGNTQSLIKKNRNGRVIAKHHGKVLNCNAYRVFKIRWKNGHLKVFTGKKNGWRTLMTFHDRHMYKIKYIGCATIGTTGKWIFSYKGYYWTGDGHMIRYPNGFWSYKLMSKFPTGYWSRLGVSKTKVVCERKKYSLCCPAGRTIEIKEAMYGRVSNKKCSAKSLKTTNCRAVSSLFKVKDACEGYQKCNVYASNTVFGDPCPRVPKYLEISYTCVRVLPGSIFRFHTKKQRRRFYRYTKLSKFGFKLTGECFEFKVKAPNDAHIALMTHDNDAKALYEIVLGGWSNKKCVIRRRRQGRAFAMVAHGPYLSSRSYRRFRVCIKRGVVSVSRPFAGGWNRFIHFRDSKPYPVKYVGLTTARWADGDWIVKQPGETNGGLAYNYINSMWGKYLTTLHPLHGKAGCPKSWINHGTSCYKAYSKKVTWKQSLNECAKVGSHLVDVHKKNEFVFVSNMVRKSSGSFWVGGTVNFLRWTRTSRQIEAPNITRRDLERVRRAGHTLCLGVRGRNQKCQWNIAGCNTKHAYICEQPVQKAIFYRTHTG